MPEVVVFLLRAVVLVLLWGFVVAAIVAVRHDVFGTKARKPPKPSPVPVPVPVPAGGPTPLPVSPPVPVKPASAAPVAPAPAAKGRRRGKVGPATRLAVIEGPHTGSSVALSSLPVTIGRADDASIVLADDYVSNHHARLIPRGADWLIEDTGSTNGTFIGDKRVTSAVVVPVGTRVRIGRNVLELQS